MPRADAYAALARRGFQLFWTVYAFLHFPLTANLWLPWPWIRHLALAAWLLSCWALARPSSLPRFAALAGVWVAADLVGLPFVPNHVLLTLFVNVTVLAALVEAAWRRRFRQGPASLETAAFAIFAPLARAEFLVLYAWAFVHKLNHGYLDPATSCGWVFYREIANRLPLLPAGDSWSRPAIGAGLLFEAALPLFLLFPRTRVATIAGGVAFHLLLSVHPDWLLDSFGCAALALLTLFVPPATLRAAAGSLARLRGLARRAAPWIAKGILAVTAGLALGLGIERDPAVAGMVARWARIAWFAWAALGASLLITAAVGARSRGAHPGDSARSLLLPPRWGLAALLPFMVLLNGASPYLGLKTETSFSMFSNLRTEAGEENHLLLPRLDWFDLQDDVVEIGASNVPDLAPFAATGERVVWFEVRRALDRRRDESLRVTYRREGPWIEASSAEPIPLLLDRALVFRPLPPAGAPPTCRH